MLENENSIKEDDSTESIITSENIVGLVHWIAKFRVKLTAMVVVPLIFSAVIYIFSDQVLKLITLPLKGRSLFFMTPVDGFMAKILVSLFGGIIIACPVLVYITFSLFSCKMKKRTRRSVYFALIPFASVAFFGGIFFAYKFILPTTIDFLIRCGGEVLTPMISGSDYVSFITFFLLSVGLVFELPLVLVSLSRIGLIKSKQLMKKRKMAILITFIVLSILTPTPDAFTLAAVSMPVLLLYEISVWWIFILEKLDKRKENIS